MRFSCADYAWPALSPDATAAVIADLGFTGVDVAVFGDTTQVRLSDVVADPGAHGRALAERLSRRGLAVADVFLTADAFDLTRLSPTSRHADDVARLAAISRATVVFADAAGAPGVTLLPGVVEEGRTADEALDLAAESLAAFVAVAADRGLAVSVEPHLGSVIPDPEATLELLARCPGLLVTLDPAHFAYQGAGVDRMLPLLGRTRHLQARFGGPGVMQSRRADNRIDYALLVHGLRELGYTGWLASEFVWMEKWECDRVDNVAESAAMLAYLRELATA